MNFLDHLLSKHRPERTGGGPPAPPQTPQPVVIVESSDASDNVVHVTCAQAAPMQDTDVHMSAMCDTTRSQCARISYPQVVASSNEPAVTVEIVPPGTTLVPTPSVCKIVPPLAVVSRVLQYVRNNVPGHLHDTVYVSIDDITYTFPCFRMLPALYKRKEVKRRVTEEENWLDGCQEVLDTLEPNVLLKLKSMFI